MGTWSREAPVYGSRATKLTTIPAKVHNLCSRRFSRGPMEFATSIDTVSQLCVCNASPCKCVCWHLVGSRVDNGWTGYHGLCTDRNCGHVLIFEHCLGQKVLSISRGILGVINIIFSLCICSIETFEGGNLLITYVSRYIYLHIRHRP